MESRALLSILGELAMLHPKLVLTQGDAYWCIPDLMKRARTDFKGANEKRRKALSAALYVVDQDSLGKLVIKNAETGKPVFTEVGAENPAPPAENAV